MGTFADTANFDYNLLFASQGKQASLFRLQQKTNRVSPFCFLMNESFHIPLVLFSEHTHIETAAYVYLRRACNFSQVPPGDSTLWPLWREANRLFTGPVRHGENHVRLQALHRIYILRYKDNIYIYSAISNEKRSRFSLIRLPFAYLATGSLLFVLVSPSA